MKLVVVVLGMILLSAGGCATILRGDKQKVKFDTDPAGATVEVDKAKYTTPAEVPLVRKAEHNVVVSKDGYCTVIFTMKAHWDGASIPSAALPGGSVWFTTDTVQGADKAFYALPKIKLTPSAGPTTQPIQMFQHRGQFLNKEQYEAVLEEEHQEALHKEIGY